MAVCLPVFCQKKLYAVLVANTESVLPGFANICKADLQTMKTEVADMAKGAGFTLVMQVASGADFNSGHLNRLIENLQTGPEDALFFYYSGAALCDTSDKAKDCNRILCLGKDGKDFLPTHQLLPKIENKQARLKISMIDACGQVRNTRPIETTRAPGSSLKIYESLFAACGSMRLFSSLCGEFSFGNEKGSLFTNAFKAALDINIRNNVQSLSWQTLLGQVHDTTVRKAQEVLRVQHPKGCFEGVGCE